MIKTIKAVIGSNFGDEGKGLVTDQMCQRLINNKNKTIVILHNGGSQRSHTVVYNGTRHAFRHFGAGSLAGADTYMASEFIVNPIFFKEEWSELMAKNVDLDSRVYVNENCRITLPYDMFVNDMKERKRNKDRHGSCGCGIYETILRNKKNSSISFRVKDCVHLSSATLLKFKKYFMRIVAENELQGYMEPYMSGVLLDSLMDHFLNDLAFMLQKIKIVRDEKEFLESYDALVFENGQGLLLDQNNKEYYPHLTPSNTGCCNIADICKTLDLSEVHFESLYVTRTYLTRHGAGYLPNECAKEDINPLMFDKTNIPNDYQGTLRYGKLDNGLLERITADYQYVNKLCDNSMLSLVITHTNEYKIDWMNFIDIDNLVDCIYYSQREDSLDAF